MDKNLLIQILRKHTASTGEEAAQIIALKKQFPFSQVLHAISARVSKDYRFEFQQNELQQAAVYATDRGVLKHIMTMEVSAASLEAPKTLEATPEIPVKENAPDTITSEPVATPSIPTTVQPVAEPQQPASVKDRLVVYQQIEKTIEDVDVAQSVLNDLEKLNRLKQNFEMLFTEQSASVTSTTSEEDHDSQPHKSKRAKIIELAKAMNSNPDNVQPTAKRKRRESQEDLIEDIKSSKGEMEPGTDRLKEQIEIIDHFIKTQPSITAVKDKNPVPPADLNIVKSGEFGDNIVSETLVEILIKQGKKDRAIEVLKKLIWKYPQKKAYFASQIEDLKK